MSEDSLARIKARLNPATIAKEAFEHLTDRVIPQGASESAQALFGQSSGFVVYGPGQEPAAIAPQEVKTQEDWASKYASRGIEEGDSKDLAAGM